MVVDSRNPNIVLLSSTEGLQADVALQLLEERGGPPVRGEELHELGA